MMRLNICDNIKVDSTINANALNVSSKAEAQSIGVESSVKGNEILVETEFEYRNVFLPAIVEDHIYDTESNPHKITCEMIGAETKGNANISISLHNADEYAHAGIMPRSISRQTILSLFN